jgi:hypothetical protein
MVHTRPDRRRSGVTRRLALTMIGLVAALIASIVTGPQAAQAASAPAAASQWLEVLSLDSPPMGLTVQDLHRRAEQAVGAALPLPDQAAVFESGYDPTWEEIEAVVAGTSLPGLTLYAIVDQPDPSSTLDKLTNGSGVSPQRSVYVFKIVCRRDHCRMKLRVKTSW